MASSPFKKLTRKQKIQSLVQATKRAMKRPFKPSRISPDRKGPANLVLVGIDTLRADHLGFHGYTAAPTSPCLDELAARGTVFEDVTAPAPWTLPSFTSALTGVMPGLHGGYLTGEVRNMDKQPPQRLNPDIITLASHLKAQGYRTAAFYSNQFFAFGLAESFDHHQYLNLPAADLSAAAREWIRQNADQPFFCFILFNDPHEPTTPKSAELSRFLAPGTDPNILESLASWGPEPDLHLGHQENADSPRIQVVLKAKLAVYDATIHGVDRVIGDLQKQLEKWNLAPSTIVSMFADHGEEFLDHLDFSIQWNHDPRKVRGIGHGHTLFQELLHVPWVSWGPGVPTGVRQKQPVSLCDLTATVLDWLALPPLQQTSVDSLELSSDLCSQLQGQSQATPAARLEKDQERFVLAEAIAYGPDLVAVRQGIWKLISRRDGQALALFDLEHDPEEKRDIQTQHPEVAARLQNTLSLWRETGIGAEEPPQDPKGWNDLNDTVRQRLRDLGYSG